MHEPSGRQQAPVGVQYVLLQSVPSPCEVPPKSSQSQGNASTQSPPTRQQACFKTAGHSVFAQLVPLPWYSPHWSAHLPGEVTVQRPLGRQQAPLIGTGPGPDGPITICARLGVAPPKTRAANNAQQLRR